jgi:ligand-binding sensor domain-containing protein
VQDGLPSNLIYCGLQDQRGLLWFGTDKGLACFDGIRFRVYGISDGLPDMEVLNMKEDSKGRLWLFCFRKKPCYMLNGQIITEKEDPLLAKIYLELGSYAMFEDRQKRVWITGAHRQLYCIDGDSLIVHDVPENIAGVWDTGNGVLALGVEYIYRIKPGTPAEVVVKINQGSDFVPFVDISLQGSSILYAYANKLVLMKWTADSMVQSIKTNITRGRVATDRNGRFWYCSSAGGAICFDNPDQSFANPVSYLPEEKMTFFFDDAQGTKWFCTFNNGLYALPKNAALKYFTDDKSQSKNIRSLARMNDGRILAGTDLSQLYILNKDKQQTVQLGASKEVKLVRQIIPESDNTIWLATDLGLFLYNLKTGYKKLYGKSYSIKSIAYSGGTLWAAFHFGFGKVSDDKSTLEKVRLYRKTAIGVDADSTVWVGGINEFLSKKDNFEINWGDTFPQLKSRIVAIATAGPNKLWVVTPDSGLLSVTVREGKVADVRVLNTHLAEPIHNIQSLFIAADSTVWMATNQGVYGLDRNWKIRHYSIYDGLIDNDVNAVLVHKDTLWAGTAAGLSSICLVADADQTAFQTLVVNLRYQNNNQLVAYHLLDSFSVRRQITLPASSANIELDLAALDYRNRGNWSFEIVRENGLLPFCWWTIPNLGSWLVNGFSAKRDTILVKSGTYNIGSHLPAGTYAFVVTAMKVSGVRSTLSDRWTLIKKPYWFETLWFYLAILALATYGIWRIYKAQIAYKEVRASASSLQLQALQSQMNPHFIGNTVNAIQQFMHPPNPEKTSEYIALFVRLLRRTMHYSEETFIAFEEEIDYCKEYLQLIQLRFEDRFHFEILGADHRVPPNTPVPSMLLQPILENATIHGIAPEGDSRVRMEVKVAKDQLLFILTDNGIGFNGTQQRKQVAGIERASKGISMLNKKINTLNRLYDLDLKLVIQDLAERQSTTTGTRVTIQYSMSKIWKAAEKLTKTARSTP